MPGEEAHYLLRGFRRARRLAHLRCIDCDLRTGPVATRKGTQDNPQDRGPPAAPGHHRGARRRGAGGPAVPGDGAAGGPGLGRGSGGRPTRVGLRSSERVEPRPTLSGETGVPADSRQRVVGRSARRARAGGDSVRLPFMITPGSRLLRRAKPYTVNCCAWCDEPADTVSPYRPRRSGPAGPTMRPAAARHSQRAAPTPYRAVGAQQGFARICPSCPQGVW